MVFLKGMRRFTYGDWLLFCFIAGLGAGMALALIFYDTGIFHAFGGAAGIGSAGTDPAAEISAAGALSQGAGRAFFGILRRREAACLIGWVVGLTVCSRFFFGLLTAHGGMSLAAILTVLTIQKGILGLPLFLAALLPQGILYGLVWGVLAGWAGQREKRLHLAPALVLLGIMAAGAFLEVWVLLMRQG